MEQSAVNFLPEDYVEKRAQTRMNFICIGLFVLMMAAIAAAFVVKERTDATVRAAHDAVNQQYEDASKRLAQVQEMEHERQRMMAKAEVTAMLLEKVPRSSLMADLTKRCGKEVSVLSLELKTKELPAPPPRSKLEEAKDAQGGGSNVIDSVAKPPPTEVTLNLTGIAPTDGHVANFISSLGKSPLLADVNLLYSEEFKLGEETLRRFKVEMKINPQADLRQKMKPDSDKEAASAE